MPPVGPTSCWPRCSSRGSLPPPRATPSMNGSGGLACRRQLRPSLHGQPDRPRDAAPALDLAADERRESLAALQVGLGALLGPDALNVRIGERGLDGGMQRVE